MLDFEKIFDLPEGHRLREVRAAAGRTSRGPCWQWEHEECDATGALVAIYESTAPQAASQPGPATEVEFVKYSPWGWVLYRSGSAAFPGKGVGQRKSAGRPARDA